MARLYADENFDRNVVVHLRNMGHDVVTVQEAGRQSQPDPLVLSYAIAHGRAVLTFNRRHFVRLHQQQIRSSTPHAGIIVCTRDGDAASLAQRVHQGVAAYPSLANQLVRIRKPPSVAGP